MPVCVLFLYICNSFQQLCERSLSGNKKHFQMLTCLLKPLGFYFLNKMLCFRPLWSFTWVWFTPQKYLRMTWKIIWQVFAWFDSVPGCYLSNRLKQTPCPSLRPYLTRVWRQHCRRVCQGNQGVHWHQRGLAQLDPEPLISLFPQEDWPGRPQSTHGQIYVPASELHPAVLQSSSS